jgi:hypothetical protein
VKQPIKLAILIAIAVFATTACGIHAIKIDAHFVGVWSGHDANSTYSLSIDNGSNGYWHQDDHGVFSTAEGVARIRHGKLLIGLHPFNIDSYPAQDSVGTWHMQLSGVEYTRQ